MNASMSEKIAAELPPLNEADQQLRSDPLGHALDRLTKRISAGHAHVEKHAHATGAVAEEARLFKSALEAAETVLIKVWAGYNEQKQASPPAARQR